MPDYRVKFILDGGHDGDQGREELIVVSIPKEDDIEATILALRSLKTLKKPGERIYSMRTRKVLK